MQIPRSTRDDKTKLATANLNLLLLGSIVTLAGANFQTTILRQNLNRAVAPIGSEISRLVGDRVLTAQFLLNREKRIGHVAHLERKKSATAGLLGDALQHFVTFVF